MNSKDLLSEISQNLEKIANERDSLRQLLEQKDRTIDLLQTQVDELSNGLDSSGISESNNLQSTQYNHSNEELKLKIDGLVEEIDECLALLNN